MCKEGEHYFQPPVVVTVTEKEAVFWFLMVNTVTKEVAFSYCRKCGKIIAYGWGLKEKYEN